MAERIVDRIAGATRVTVAAVSRAGDAKLTSIDATGFTRDELVRALDDRNLDTTGTDEQLRARLTLDVNGA